MNTYHTRISILISLLIVFLFSFLVDSPADVVRVNVFLVVILIRAMIAVKDGTI